MSLIDKVQRSLRYDGFWPTIAQIIRYPFKPLLKRRVAEKWTEVLRLQSAEERFHAIYRNNLWGSGQSVSGYGSTLHFTQNLRQELPRLIETYSIGSIFDAPCGDFNWMKHALKNARVSYIGGDIVKPLIDSLNAKYRSDAVSFVHMDLTKGPFPPADLMICRDCLFHLSYADAKSVFRNFVDSGIPYLLTTTHMNEGKFVNRDIETGDAKFIDLFSAPYNFPSNPLSKIEDWQEPFPKREMCLWSREQVSVALSAFHLET